LEGARAVDPRGLEHLRVLRLQAGQDDQHHERRPAPDFDGHHRDHRELVDPVDAAQAERGEQIRKQPEQRVEQGVLPDQGSGRRHDEERRDHQGPHEPLAEDVRVEEHGHREPKHDRDPDHAQSQENRVPDRYSDARVGDERRVVLEPRELEASRLEQVPLEEAVVDGEHEGDLRDQEDVDERREQRQAARPPLPAGNGGRGRARASVPGRRPEESRYVLYFLPTASASACALTSAWSTVWPPAMTLANSCETWSPSCWNSSMSTYWIPTYGTGCTVACVTSAWAMESTVTCANAPAACWYSGIE